MLKTTLFKSNVRYEIYLFNFINFKFLIYEFMKLKIPLSHLTKIFTLIAQRKNNIKFQRIFFFYLPS